MRISTMAAYAAPSIGLAGLNLPLLIFIPAYYNSAMGLSLTLVGTALLIVRLLDIGFDPLVGALMDRTRTRHGRFRPWLVSGLLVIALGTFALFMPPTGVGLGYLIGCLLITYAGHSMCYLAQLAWGATLSDDYQDRSRIFGWWQAANMVGVLLSVCVPLFVPGAYQHMAQTLSLMAVGIITVLALGIAIAVLGVPEVAVPAARPRLPVSAYLRLLKRPTISRLLLVDLLIGMAVFTHGPLYFFYFHRVKGVDLQVVGIFLMLTNTGALLGSAVWSQAATRLGKHRAAVIAFFLYAATLPLTDWLPASNVVLFGIFLLFRGVTLSAGPLLLRSMMADAGDEERLRSGEDHTSLLSALFAASNKIGGALGPALSLMALGWTGFDGATAQSTPEQLERLTQMMIWAPATLGMICAVVIAGYPLTARVHAGIRAQLAAGARPESTPGGG